MSAPIGLLAGWGRFPLVFAEKARSLGRPVLCVGLRGAADPKLAKLVSRFHWCGVAQLGRMIRLFKREGVEQIVMAGKVMKFAIMNAPWRVFTLMPDLRGFRVWFNRRRIDNRDDSILLNVIDEFAKDGMRFESALELCPELLVSRGLLTRRKPTVREEKDIAFGWSLAREMGRLDIGQSVAVKEKAVLAVEAIEGTDRAISRASEFCPRGEFVVVKVAKPHQDMRFDVPTIGCLTVETMHKARARVLAIEAGKTIVLDQAQTVALADKYGISIVALDDSAVCVDSVN
ncbi:MAG: LpxI family protein [Gemmataceae bacterium]